MGDVPFAESQAARATSYRVREIEMGGPKKAKNKSHRKPKRQAAPTEDEFEELPAEDIDYEKMLGGETVLSPEQEKAAAIVQWMNEQVRQEAADITARGCRALPMEVQKIVVEREKADVGETEDGEAEMIVTNVLSIDTNFDFDRIQQIVVSDPPVVCPISPDLHYVNIGCLTEKPLPLMLPFVFRPDSANHMDRWCFINATGKRSVHAIQHFQPV